MEWFRWHHGTSTDPKWRLVAADSGQPVHAVLAVWTAMLECASQSEERGSLNGWNDRVVAVALDLSPSAVTSIRQAMQGLVLDGDVVPSWTKRQPKREDDSSDRVKAWRKRQQDIENSQKRDVTHGNSRTEQSRTEEIEDSEAIASVAEATPLADPVKDLWALGVEVLGASSRSMIGKARKDYGDLITMEALLACRAAAPSHPVEFFVGCLKQRGSNAKRRTPAEGIYAGFAAALADREADRGDDSPVVVPLLGCGRA